MFPPASRSVPLGRPLHDRQSIPFSNASYHSPTLLNQIRHIIPPLIPIDTLIDRSIQTDSLTLGQNTKLQSNVAVQAHTVSITCYSPTYDYAYDQSRFPFRLHFVEATHQDRMKHCFAFSPRYLTTIINNIMIEHRQLPRLGGQNGEGISFVYLHMTLSNLYYETRPDH